MLAFLTRIYRHMFNPYAAEEQLWRLDGVGLIVIVGTSDHGPLLSRGIQWRRLNEGEEVEHSLPASIFYGSAVLAPRPTLLDFDDLDKPKAQMP